MHAWIPLFAAVVGGMIVSLGSVAVAWHLRRRRIRAYRLSLAAEIATCIQIARLNAYAEQFAQTAADLRRAGTWRPSQSMHVPARHNYFTVYEAGTAELGELGSELRIKIVFLYQAMRAWLDSTSRDNIPPPGAAHPSEEAHRHEALARQIARICELGEELISGLVGHEGVELLTEAKKVLAAGPIAPLLPRVPTADAIGSQQDGEDI